MASFENQLSFFLLLLLLLSPQIQAREGKFFSFFTHFRTTYNNVKDAQLSLAKAESPAPASTPETAPTPAPLTAPAPEIGSTIPSGPAPEPEFLDMGEGYGLYGRDSSSSTQYSPTKDTATTTTNFENELLNVDFNGQSYKTGYPQTNFRSNYNNEEYTKNYNSEEYRSNDNNGKEFYYNNNNNYGNNGYEGKREGMSDTRFMENGKYHYNVDSENDQSYNFNRYDESGRGRTENEGYDEKKQYPNEFDTMEEYEKQQEAQGYTP